MAMRLGDDVTQVFGPGGQGERIDHGPYGLEFRLPDSGGVEPRFVSIRDNANSTARELFEQSGITLKSRT